MSTQQSCGSLCFYVAHAFCFSFRRGLGEEVPLAFGDLPG